VQGAAPAVFKNPHQHSEIVRTGPSSARASPAAVGGGRCTSTGSRTALGRRWHPGVVQPPPRVAVERRPGVAVYRKSGMRVDRNGNRTRGRLAVRCTTAQAGLCRRPGSDARAGEGAVQAASGAPWWALSASAVLG
jgi:hypothetical protein